MKDPIVAATRNRIPPPRSNATGVRANEEGAYGLLAEERPPNAGHADVRVSRVVRHQEIAPLAELVDQPVAAVGREVTLRLGPQESAPS